MLFYVTSLEPAILMPSIPCLYLYCYICAVFGLDIWHQSLLVRLSAAQKLYKVYDLVSGRIYR